MNLPLFLRILGPCIWSNLLFVVNVDDILTMYLFLSFISFFLLYLNTQHLIALIITERQQRRKGLKKTKK